VLLDPAKEVVQFDGSAVVGRDPPEVAAEHLVHVNEVGVRRAVLGDALELRWLVWNTGVKLDPLSSRFTLRPR
jgi:hypothetical protein